MSASGSETISARRRSSSRIWLKSWVIAMFPEAVTVSSVERIFERSST